MSFFTSFLSSKPAVAAEDPDGETIPAKMNLEERMTFRREMLFDSVSFTMEHKGIPVDSYRLRISRIDKRGHSFAVMLDLSNDFLRSAYGTLLVLGEIGREIAETAKASGFLEVVGVYWRVCDEPGLIQAAHADTPTSQPRGVVPQLRTQCDPRVYASDLAPLGEK